MSTKKSENEISHDNHNRTKNTGSQKPICNHHQAPDRNLNQTSSSFHNPALRQCIISLANSLSQ